MSSWKPITELAIKTKYQLIHTHKNEIRLSLLLKYHSDSNDNNSFTENVNKKSYTCSFLFQCSQPMPAIIAAKMESYFQHLCKDGSLLN